MIELLLIIPLPIPYLHILVDLPVFIYTKTKPENGEKKNEQKNEERS
jgi:hypothetical protein